MAYSITILSIGKIKDTSTQKIEQEYLKRLRLFKVRFIELKGHAGDIEKEGESILKKLHEYPNAKCLLLAENGEQVTSEEMAKKIQHYYEVEGVKELFFIIGGALGHSENLRKKISHHLSLSKLTFPHQLVRPILAEQLYRIETILAGHPYHH